MTTTQHSVDLARAWGARVRANREQAERVRESADGDFYAPSWTRFVADPRRTDDPTLDELVAIARRGETWLDIGAGAGRYALPMAMRVGEVIAIDPSPSMLEGLRAGMAEHGIANIRPIRARWPVGTGEGPSFRGDVALIAHVGYDIEEIGPFLDAMEAAAARLCVAVMADRAPSSPAARFWPAVHGEERVPLPALDDFVALLLARGVAPSVKRTARAERSFSSRDDALRWLRTQCFVQPGSPADRRLEKALSGVMPIDGGPIALVGDAGMTVGVVTWASRPARPAKTGPRPDTGIVL